MTLVSWVTVPVTTDVTFPCLRVFRTLHTGVNLHRSDLWLSWVGLGSGSGRFGKDPGPDGDLVPIK